MLILVDIDSTVAHMMPEWLRRYNIEFNDALTEDRITAWGMTGFVKPECGNQIYKYLRDSDLYDSVEPYDGALMVIKEMKKRGHRVVFATAGVVGGLSKYNWLLKWRFLSSKNGEENYVVAFDKSLLRGDFLIDDRDKNVAQFNPESILMTRPWNSNFQWNRRARDWFQVLTFLNVKELGYD